MKRCKWCLSDQIYIDYHDNEWGVPLYEDNKIFEFLVLESMQAGLSWITILRKRDNFRKAFASFDVNKVALFDSENIKKLSHNSGIIRNKLKINAAVNNAKCFITIQKEFGSFSQYIWKFTDYKQIIHDVKTEDDVPVKNKLSELICKDLKKRGMKFIGHTIIYSFLQAIGIIDDHVNDCIKKNRN